LEKSSSRSAREGEMNAFNRCFFLLFFPTIDLAQASLVWLKKQQ
jgi:hypothetical protein